MGSALSLGKCVQSCPDFVKFKAEHYLSNLRLPRHKGVQEKELKVKHRTIRGPIASFHFWDLLRHYGKGNQSHTEHLRGSVPRRVIAANTLSVEGRLQFFG